MTGYVQFEMSAFGHCIDIRECLCALMDGISPSGGDPPMTSRNDYNPDYEPGHLVLYSAAAGSAFGVPRWASLCAECPYWG